MTRLASFGLWVSFFFLFYLYYSQIIVYILYYYQKVSKYIFFVSRSGLALARPDWPGVSLTLGQGHLSWPDPEGAGSRASKNGLALAQPSPWDSVTRAQ